MRIGIIEDERPAQQHLISLITKLRPETLVLFTCESVKESIMTLKVEPNVDLIFMDIQLNDGLSFDIFEDVDVKVPVIFTTAFDQYTLNAFQSSGIDYLLKPLKLKEIESALNKYDKMSIHFNGSSSQTYDLSKFKSIQKTQRFLVKKGVRFISVDTSEVACFFSEHKVTFLLDKHGEKFIYDKPLSVLEEILDTSIYFRLNRQYLVNISTIHSFSSDGKGRLNVVLKPMNEEVLVSQEKASEFKTWLGGD